MKSTVSSCLVVVLLLCVASVRAGQLVFSDDFTSLDNKVWKHEITLAGGGNWEFQYYTNNRSNTFVRDGVLYIKPTLTADTIGEANVVGNGYTMDLWGLEPASLCTSNGFYGCSRTAGGGGNYLNPIQSARITTSKSFNMKYGQVEVRARMPMGDWIWPAIYLLPRYNAYGAWPASGEIDIVQSRGNSPSYPAGGYNTIGSELHWGPYVNADMYKATRATYSLLYSDFAYDFHTFGLMWTEDRIMTYVDSVNNVVLSVQTNDTSFWKKAVFPSGTSNPWEGRPMNAPFDQEFYLVFTMAVGGVNGYFPDGFGGKPWSDADPHAVNAFYNARGQWLPTWSYDKVALQIDSVKVWSL